MIWLASFPRSGSTFFRIVLDEVYGIESGTFHRETSYPVDDDYTDYQVVKTHLLPSELTPEDASIPAVYLVRDGRDCMISLAHYRQQLLAPESDFYGNVLEAIDAAEGSHFGGWSRHVRTWCERASLVIHFEHLIADPIGCVEQLRPYIDLPSPKTNRLPQFTDLRSKDFKYGSGMQHGFGEQQRKHWRESKFRAGRSGGWRDELPEPLHLRFLRRHGHELARLGYVEELVESNQRSSYISRLHPARVRTCTIQKQAKDKKRVLIDVSKLLDTKVDGIKRYVQELLCEMIPIARERKTTWELDVCFAPDAIFPLLEITEDIEQARSPVSQIPRLLQPGQGNPLCECAERLQTLNGRWGWDLIRETAWLNCLKTVRSLQKRWRDLKLFMLRLHDSWYQVFSRTKCSDYDLVHLTLPNTWKLYKNRNVPLLTTVHDLCHLACPEFQTKSNNQSLTAGIQFAEKVRSDYLAVSESTKEQMVRLLDVHPQRIKVVHEGCNKERFQPIVCREDLDRVRSKYGIPDEPYVLSVGTLEPRKNLLNTVRAFHRLTQEAPELKANLVIAGSFGWGNAKELQDTIENCTRVYRIGYVDDDDLAALYSAAAVFCYVSHYEGFGLPLLEAMSCGAPTIYGNSTSMPEIVASAGLGAQPDDVTQISDRLRELLTNTALRRKLARRAVIRSLDFDWTHSAEQTFACYEHFIERHQQSRHEELKQAEDRRSACTTSEAKRGKNVAA